VALESSSLVHGRLICATLDPAPRRRLSDHSEASGRSVNIVEGDVTGIGTTRPGRQG